MPIEIKGYKQGIEEERKRILKILSIFKDESVYTGRVVKFEIKNRLKEK